MGNIFESENLECDLFGFILKLNASLELQHTVNVINRPVVKKYHRIAYVFALFIGKIREEHSESHKFLFLSELLSDLLSNCQLVVLGFKQSSLILNRRMIENFYNHIYYFDHPIEYQLLNLGKNDYVPMLELKSYYELHPSVRIFEDTNLKDFNSHVFNHYQSLCRVVHTKGENFMGLAKNLEEIRPKFDLIEHLSQTNITMQGVLYLLFKFHRNLIYTNIEKDLISKTFARNYRKSLFS